MNHKPTKANASVDAPPAESRRRRSVRVVLWCVSAAFATLSVTGYISYHQERAEIRRYAEELVQGIDDPVKRVLRLNTWVHRFLPTARNESYFVVPKLRATPRQVLRGGGDCADKARLLVALLEEINIPASMALCFHPETGKPSHTVVEARPAHQSPMLVDPAYELYYPKPDGAGYYSLLDLRQHPERLQERLNYVWDTVPRFRPLHWYNPDVAGFAGLSTINWRRNQVTALIHDLIYLGLGPKTYSLPRPRVVESPKLALCAVAALLALVSLGIQRLLCRTVLFRSGTLHKRPAERCDGRRTLTTPAPPALVGPT